MFAKLLAIIATVAVTAAALLVLRHQRLESAHELATIDRDMTRHQYDLWELRAELSERTAPQALQVLLETLPHDWQSIPSQAPDARPTSPPLPAPDLVIHDTTAPLPHATSSQSPS